MKWADVIANITINGRKLSDTYVPKYPCEYFGTFKVKGDIDQQIAENMRAAWNKSMSSHTIEFKTPLIKSDILTAGNEEKKCTCDAFDFLKGGCTCGAVIPWEQRNNPLSIQKDEVSIQPSVYADSHHIPKWPVSNVFFSLYDIYITSGTFHAPWVLQCKGGEGVPAGRTEIWQINAVGPTMDVQVIGSDGKMYPITTKEEIWYTQ